MRKHFITIDFFFLKNVLLYSDAFFLLTTLCATSAVCRHHFCLKYRSKDVASVGGLDADVRDDGGNGCKLCSVKFS